jgi:shikimate kinase
VIDDAATDVLTAAASGPSVFLVGCMGSGKSTIGRQLGRLLHRPFHDSDRVIEERTGADIPLIFEREGEAGFREREERILDELTSLPRIVLATGGGAVLSPASRERLHRRGFVVYLQAGLNQLIERTRGDRGRPLLQTADPRARLQEILQARDPLYREVAHLIVPTGHRTVRQLTHLIAVELARLC